MRVPFLLTAAAAGLLAAGTGTALADKKPKANDCGDPYWAQTLRCQYAAAGEAPQPNLGNAPSDVGGIRPFTRVFLTSEPSIRSVDGTYPVMYVDKAVCTRRRGCGGVPLGEPVESNKWLITVPGGGACTQEDCVSMYASSAERKEMSTSTDPPMKSLEGIHTPVPEVNPIFAGYNRVRVEKSSYDRYMGRSTYESSSGRLVFSHGLLIMEEALRALRNGLRYGTWADVEGELTAVHERLPALAKAEQVVFVGHSGGSHGMFHNIDHLATLLDGFGRFRGDVRVVFDENFTPGIQNEAAFATPPAGDSYSNIWTGTSSANGVTFDYDGETFLTSGALTQQYLDWNALMDASCLAHHAVTDGATWKCNERQHVVLNHVSTPFFLKEDFSDPNTDHNDAPSGHEVRWGDPVTRLTQAEFGQRVMAQARSLIEASSARSELGTAFPTFFVWMANCETHSGVYDDHTYFGTAIDHDGSIHSLREWVEEFVASPRQGGTEWLVHGYPGTDMTSDCEFASAEP